MFVYAKSYPKYLILIFNIENNRTTYFLNNIVFLLCFFDSCDTYFAVCQYCRQYFKFILFHLFFLSLAFILGQSIFGLLFEFVIVVFFLLLYYFFILDSCNFALGDFEKPHFMVIGFDFKRNLLLRCFEEESLFIFRLFNLKVFLLNGNAC